MAEKTDEEKKQEEQRKSDYGHHPKAAQGDMTPAGYLGYDGPKETSPHDEAKTATLDDQAHAKPLDPKMAGPEAQAKEKAAKRPVGRPRKAKK